MSMRYSAAHQAASRARAWVHAGFPGSRGAALCVRQLVPMPIQDLQATGSTMNALSRLSWPCARSAQCGAPFLTAKPRVLVHTCCAGSQLAGETYLGEPYVRSPGSGAGPSGAAAGAPPMVQGLNHAAVGVQNVEASVAWYQQVRHPGVLQWHAATSTRAPRPLCPLCPAGVGLHTAASPRVPVRRGMAAGR